MCQRHMTECPESRSSRKLIGSDMVHELENGIRFGPIAEPIVTNNTRRSTVLVEYSVKYLAITLRRSLNTYQQIQT